MCLEIGARKETQFDLAVERSALLAVTDLEVARVQEDLPAFERRSVDWVNPPRD